MRVLCIYRSGGDYNADYVLALKYGVDEYLGCSHSFYCITDVPEEFISYDVDVIPMRYSWPGWWSKFELFRPDLEYVDTTIYFDLDIMLKADCTAFSDLCRRSSTPIMLRSADPVGEGNDWPSSSIMSWKRHGMRSVWKAWIKSPVKNRENQIINGYHKAGQKTDQGFIRNYVDPRFFQDELSNNYIVFKLHYLSNVELFKTCNILNWTGKPRYASMPIEYWDIESLWKSRVFGGKKLFKKVKTNQVL